MGLAEWAKSDEPEVRPGAHVERRTEEEANATAVHDTEEAAETGREALIEEGYQYAIAHDAEALRRLAAEDPAAYDAAMAKYEDHYLWEEAQAQLDPEKVADDAAAARAAETQRRADTEDKGGEAGE